MILLLCLSQNETNTWVYDLGFLDLYCIFSISNFLPRGVTYLDKDV